MNAVLRKAIYKQYEGKGDHWNQYRGWVAASILTVGIAVFAGGLFLLALTVDRKVCDRKGQAMGVPHRYGRWTNCMVQIDGKWVPLANYRLTTQTGGQER